MSHTFFSPLRIVLVTVAAMLLAAGQAQARRRGNIITSGPSVSELGTLTPEVSESLRKSSQKKVNTVGFFYQNFGLFWLDFWTWDGKYVLYDKGNDSVAYPVSKEEAADYLGVDESKIGKPFNYRFPYGLDIIVVIGLLKIVPRMLMKRKQASQVTTFDPNKVPEWTPPARPEGQPPVLPPQGAGGPPPIPPPLPPEEK